MKYDGKNPNRLAFFNKLGINPEKGYGLKQVHSRKVTIVDGDNPPLEEADGMVTKDSSLCLSVTVADCLPVFLLDTLSGAFGIVHSGWKGTGIAVDALDLMKNRFGTKADDVAAILGPCIGSCCYKVDINRAAIFEKDFGIESVQRKDGGFFLDLKAANNKLLTDAGVRNIAVCEDCTCCDERFSSFRREGEVFTRMIALVMANSGFSNFS